MRSKLLLLSVTAVVLSSCSSGSGSGDKVPKPEAPKYCVDEKDLLAPPQGIVGGQTVEPYSTNSKSVVMLLTKEGEICTAAPIASDVLLTAAHCITASAEDTFIVTYSSLSCESGFDSRKNTQAVVAVVAHENYRSEVKAVDSQSDVALVFLKESLPWGYPVYQIANPELVSSSSSIYFFGYGRVGYEKGGSGILRHIMKSRDEFEILPAEAKVKLNQKAGTGICSGDSGGPGLVTIDGELQILGVNSYVYGEKPDICRGESYLALADHYTSWIETNMRARGRTLKK